MPGLSGDWFDHYEQPECPSYTSGRQSVKGMWLFGPVQSVLDSGPCDEGLSLIHHAIPAHNNPDATVNTR